MKYIKPIILGLAAAGVMAYADPAATTAAAPAGVHTNAALTQSLLGNQAGTGNVQALMDAKKSGALADGVTLGGYAEAAAVYEKVSDAGSDASNSYQTHLANMSSTAGSANATSLIMPRAELAVMANMNDWTAALVTFGVRGVSAGGVDTLGVDSAVVTVGNLNQLPVYAFVGRNTVDFGSFSSVNFSTPSLNKLAFQAYGDQLGFGYEGYGFTAALSFMNDNSTSGAANNMGTAYNTYTQKNDAVGNYAVNVGYGMNTAGADWHVGVGYLNGSKVGTNANADEVGAYDLNAKVGFSGFDFMGEFTQTTGDVYGNTSKLRAWDLGADYNLPVMGKASKVSVDYSRVSANYAASQWVVGFSHNTFDNVWMGVEYAQAKGTFVAGSSSNTVYTYAYNAAPTSATDVSDAALLFDVQGVF